MLSHSHKYLVNDFLDNNKTSQESEQLGELLEPDIAKEVCSVGIKKLIPSIIQPPDLELKSLPENLKYAFLEENKKLPVIIFSSLSKEEEAKLVKVLKENKKALGWSLAYILGISPDICSHRILLEENVKPKRQPQQRLIHRFSKW